MTKSAQKGDEPWSSFYDEDKDDFEEFQQFELCDDLPQRQLSGSVVEEDTAKEWEEDWEDEVCVTSLFFIVVTQPVRSDDVTLPYAVRSVSCSRVPG